LQNLFFFVATVRVENLCCVEGFREYQRLKIGGVLVTKKQNPKIKNPKVKDPFSEVSDHRDILAITEGHYWRPVTRKDQKFELRKHLFPAHES